MEVMEDRPFKWEFAQQPGRALLAFGAALSQR
jgi:hypothetical protein